MPGTPDLRALRQADRPAGVGSRAMPPPAAAAPPDMPAPAARSGDRVGAVLKGIAGAVVALLLWELLRRVGVLPSSIVPSTPTVVSALLHGLSSGDLLGPLGQTAKVWAYGLLATIAVAVPLGMLVGLSRWADAATFLLFDIARPVPAVALVPVAVVLLGLGTRMQVPLVVLAAMWPLLYNTRYGVQNVDPSLLDSGRSVGLSRAALLRRVVVPSALPSVLTGLRLAASIALIVTIVTELVASATGLGQYINLSQQAGQYADALAGVLLAGLFGCAITATAVLLESRALRWHRGMTKARE